MGKRLSDNLSSLYIGAANRLKPKRQDEKLWLMLKVTTMSLFGVPYWESLKMILVILK